MTEEPTRHGEAEGADNERMPTMEIDQILHELERAAGRFPREAVEAAIARREEITPELMGILRKTMEHAAEIDADYMGHIYAMFLLAQFREIRAYPLVVEFGSLPGDLPDTLCGDFIAGSYGRVLASVCGGDVSGIQSLIENEAVNVWVRSSAVYSLVTLVAAGQKSREEIVGYFGELFRGKLERRFSQVWNALVSCAADLYPGELMADIEHAYEDDLVDIGYIGWDGVKRESARGKDHILARLADDPHRCLVNDTVREMEWWACFDDESPAVGTRRDQPKTGQGAPEDTRTITVPVRRDQPKVGRNDPCPCGSGKKFKKCCGA